MTKHTLYFKYRGIPPELEGVLKIHREFAREHLCEIVVLMSFYLDKTCRILEINKRGWGPNKQWGKGERGVFKFLKNNKQGRTFIYHLRVNNTERT